MPHLHLGHKEKCDGDYCHTNYDVVFIGSDFYLLSITSCNHHTYMGKHEFIENLLHNSLDKVGVIDGSVYRTHYNSIERIRKMDYHMEGIVHDVCYVYSNAAHKEFCVCCRRRWMEKFMANQDIREKHKLFKKMVLDLFSEDKEMRLESRYAEYILGNAEDLLRRNEIDHCDIDIIRTTDYLIKKLKEYARTGKTDSII